MQTTSDRAPVATLEPVRPADSPDSRRRIMIVDDHPITRVGLASLIDSQLDLRVCGEAANPVMALSRLPLLRPDLVLVDLNMPGRGGIEFIKDLISFLPSQKILVLTMQNEEEFAERAVRAGASGYIMKTEGGEMVVTAVRRVLAGDIYLSPAMSARLLRAMTGPARQRSTPASAALSDREIDVFQLIGQGCDTGEIAARLRISRKTVDVHRGAIKRKLGLASPTALVRQAVRWVDGVNGSDPRPA